MGFFDFLNTKLDETTQTDVENSTPKKDEADLLKYIAHLRPEDIDRLLDIAKGEIYRDRSETVVGKSMTDYVDLLRSVYGSTSNFNSIGNSPQTRKQRYEIYEEMDESTAFISSALDILSDDATQMDDSGTIIHVRSGSDKVTNLVNEFIAEFELEEKASKWARAIAKYGDLFIRVEGEYSKGVTYINDTIYPGIIERRDLNGKLVAFTNNQNAAYSSEDFYTPWDFVHFRHKGDIYKEESNYARQGILDDGFTQNLTSAYGQSVLRPAIKVYAQLRFVENMILLSRLTNSIRRNIFLINVGEVSPDKAYETISNYAKLLKKDINLNIEDNMYSAQKHTVNYDEDIFIPVADPQNDVRIETVGGDANVKEQYDLEYLLNKLFSALKIPKAYLNYEQDLNARSTLVQLDIRYARSVSQLQHTLISGIRRLVNIHLAYLGLDPDDVDLEISLTSVSDIDKDTRMEQRATRLNTARDTWDLLTNMGEFLGEEKPLRLDVAAEYIMQEYLEFDQSLINQVFGRKEEEAATVKVKINSHKSYSATDALADYPVKDKSTYSEFERVRESLLGFDYKKTE